MMMPEPFLPWDREEQQLRDHRRHWRAEPYPCPRQGYGWVMGVAGGGGPIWMEAHSHSIPYPYPYHPYYHPSPRWTSDFRSRAAPTGYGRQGTHFYPEDDGNRFVQSRPSGRFRGNKRFRASRGKKKSKVSRGSKPSHNKKDTDNSFPDAAPSLNDPDRSNDVGDQQKSVDVLLTCSSNPHSNSCDSSDRSQPEELLEKNDGLDMPVDSQLKEQHDDNDALDTPVGSQLKEQHEDNDALDTPVNTDVQQGHESTTLSPSGDSDNPVAAIHAPKPTEARTVSLEEIVRCKTRRLGWGEGLAKYEKQKIEHNDDSVPNNDMVVCSNSGEQMHVLALKLTDKCPMVNAFPDCASPTTPLAISCGPSPGYAKQGTNFYPEDGVNRFVQSRPSGKFRGNKRFRASRGKQNSWLSRGSKPFHNKKDTDSSFPEAAPSLNDPERLNDVSDQQKSVDDLLTSSSSPRSNSSHSSDQSQPKELLEKNDGLDTPVDSQLKEQHEDNEAFDTPAGSQLKEQHEDNDGLDVPVGSSQAFERANSFGSIDWRTKWTRPGSLYSRRFSHSSYSESKDVECKEVKIDVQQDHETTTISPHGDSDIPVAAIHAPKPTEARTVSLEEIGRCKKRRLGWGEGLVKFEKQKIEQTDESASKNDMVVCSNNGEQMHVLASRLTDKCPMVNAFPECTSPTTPLASNCGPSPATEVKQLLTDGNIEHVKANLNPIPVTEQKQSMKDGSILHDKANLSVSSNVAYQYHLEGRSFKLQNADLMPVASLNSAIIDLPLSESSVCSDFITSTDINKLVVMKRDVLKAIELIESDIDKIECELKSVSEEENIHDQSSSSNSLPVDCVLEYALKENAVSQVTGQSSSLESAVHTEMPHAEEFLAADGNNEDVEAYSLGKHLSSDLENQVQIPLKTDNIAYLCWDANNITDGLIGDNIPRLFASCYGSQLDVKGILASNRDIAIRAGEVLNKLLPANECTPDISNAIENTDMIKAKFLVRKNFLQFKERVLAIKSRAFQHLWKEVVHFLSKKDFRMKPQKKMDLSVPSPNRHFWKRCSSMRSRDARHRHLIANAETINLVGKLISSNQVKPMRKALKMPALILDENEKKTMRFVTTNGLVEDPCAFEKERSLLNIWTEEEKEIFMDQLSTRGKDFTKISSFLVHKTTADCIEFYYKNHKAEWFRRPEKKEKHYLTNHYLIMSGTQCIPEGTASSLDILGAATLNTENADDGTRIQQKGASGTQCIPEGTASATLNTANADDGTRIQQKGASEKVFHTSPWKVSRDGTRLLLKRSVGVDLDDSESQTVSPDVISGVRDSLPQEATSSCITGAVDPSNGCHKRKTYNKKWASNRLPSTLEVSQSVGDDTFSGENIDEMDYADWTDEEKSMFMEAVSSYGKDFAKLSGHIKTRTEDECKIFFSKVHKCASLDTVCPGSANVVCTEANVAVSEPVENLSSGIAGQEPGFLETSMNKHDEKDNYVSPRNESTPEHDIELKMHDSDAANIASCFHDICENQQVDLHSNSVEKPCGGTGIISSPQSNYPLLVKPVSSGFFGVPKCANDSHEGTSFAIDFEKKGYQGKETSGQISSFKKPVIDSGITGFHLPNGSFLQKCNGTKQNSSVPERPVFSSEKSRNYYKLCSQSENPSCVDKPYQGRNIKLFGQILTKPSSQQKLSQNTRQHRNNNENQNEAVKKSYSVKLTGDSSSALEKFGVYGIPQTPNFAYHGEGRIQPDFPSLPFSVNPLTKYPDAYRNYYPVSPEIEQLPLQEINGGNRSLVDGSSIIPGSRKIRTNGVFSYQMINSREGQPFGLDMQQPPPPPQESVFPKKLRNRLELALGVQKSGRRFVGLQDSEFSDPGLTMHYSQDITGWLRTQRIDGQGVMHGGNYNIRR